MMNATIKQLLVSDTLYDEKSLVYQAGTLEQIEDLMDSSKIPEGRLGEFRLERIKTRMGVILQLPVTKAARELSQTVPAEDTEICYQRCCANRFFMLKKVDAALSAQITAGLNSDENLTPWETETPNEQMAQWIGLVDSGSAGPMLGIVRMIFGKDNFVYLLYYAGIGNFTDIRMEETEIMKALYRRISK